MVIKRIVLLSGGFRGWQGLLWISTCVLALLFLYCKADEQLGVIQSLRRGQSVVPVIPDLWASQRASGALSR